jgi:hypothetical protein
MFVGQSRGKEPRGVDVARASESSRYRRRNAETLLSTEDNSKNLA